DMKTTLWPPAWWGSAPSTEAPTVLPAFTTRAGATRSATTSLAVRPWRSLGSKSLVGSITIRPSQSSPSTAYGTSGHITATTTMSAAAASLTVPADTPPPSPATTVLND